MVQILETWEPETLEEAYNKAPGAWLGYLLTYIGFDPLPEILELVPDTARALWPDLRFPVSPLRSYTVLTRFRFLTGVDTGDLLRQQFTLEDIVTRMVEAQFGTRA